MRRLAAIRRRQIASGKPTRRVRSNRRRWVRLAQAEEDSYSWRGGHHAG